MPMRMLLRTVLIVTKDQQKAPTLIEVATIIVSIHPTGLSHAFHSIQVPSYQAKLSLI